MKRRVQQRLLVAALLFAPLSLPAADEPTTPERGEQTRQVDRLELDSSAVTGNQELPRVLYIVPWKASGIGELQGKPVNSLLDEVLAPIDRDVFQRQVRYFEQIYETEPLAAADD
ncbi:MAG: hypothetical protein V2J12_09515 [Gammaproteobacteria bacterium]|nr:hypothetical protein [Gammaproteobacteria bacterium]